MAKVTERLHRSFVEALKDRVIEFDDIRKKPLLVDLEVPMPYRLRVYLYSLVMGAAARKGEMKANLRVPSQPVGEYASFDFSDDRIVLLVGYREDIDVFVLWDASLHPKFKNGGNVQVKEETVLAAAVEGFSKQRRRLVSGITEIIFACRPVMLAKAISERVSWTGGVSE